jgi:hypothetical protein
VTQSPEPRPAGDGRKLGGYAGRKGQLPTWPRVGVVLLLFAFTFFFAKSCQDDQIKITQDEAVALAKQQVDFVPENTQIRLLRQGLDRRPTWVVSLSIPKGPEGPNPDRFERLALVRIDATNGKIDSVQEQETGGGDASGERAGANQGQP